MKKKLIALFSSVRAIAMRTIFPSSGYFLATHSIKPLSNKFGFDRGTPIDRFWIERFIEKNKKDIRGNVLEIGDRRYTSMFGGDNVITSDVLDITKNKEITILADLSSANNVNDNSFDCIILTHVLGIIPEYQRALEECHRMLRKNGVLLITVSTISPVQNHSPSLWRFTHKGLEYATEKIFGDKNIHVSTYGNVLAGQCFWVGMSKEELTEEELLYNDPEYPCIATCRAVKR